MVLPGEDDWKRQVIERAKELDHEHRRRVRGAFESSTARVLALRLLRQALRRLVSRPRRFDTREVPHPLPGHIAVTFVGHASVMLTTRRARVLVDPFFGEFLLGVRRKEAASLATADRADTSLILITHAHRDRLHLPTLRKLPRRATIVLPARCQSLVQRLGFARVVELQPGQSFEHNDVEVTAVAARHDGRRGPINRAWRPSCGYIVKCAGANVYCAGDTAYFSGFEEIGRRLHPDVALLPIAGYEPPGMRDDHMSPLDAVQAFIDLGAKLLVPVAYGSFPVGYEPIDEPLAWLVDLCRQRGLLDRLFVLRPGESCDVHGRETSAP
ncbi:MAG: MBL fold metallo-hydrolase [Deltaproteobacteria bacterium]|jgi:L-ascorbate metabolism protein UlaG (beta-lactamase superfamily)|nr:MBL fold metallo-hydrolase [Deltaproteobacteria bacterium]